MYPLFIRPWYILQFDVLLIDGTRRSCLWRGSCLNFPFPCFCSYTSVHLLDFAGRWAIHFKIQLMMDLSFFSSAMWSQPTFYVLIKVGYRWCHRWSTCTSRNSTVNLCSGNTSRDMGEQHNNSGGSSGDGNVATVDCCCCCCCCFCCCSLKLKKKAKKKLTWYILWTLDSSRRLFFLYILARHGDFDCRRSGNKPAVLYYEHTRICSVMSAEHFSCY